MLRVLRKLGGSSPETVARRATNEERFGPSSEDLSRLSSLSYKPKTCDKMLQVVEHRFKQNKRHWRQKLKALTVLQYFLLHGSPQCTEWMTENRQLLEELTKFSYEDQYNVDQGRSVRDKAETLLSFLDHPEKVEEAKEKYKKQRESVRKSIGTGRPSTTSRNTLEMLRDNIFDEPVESVQSPQLPSTPFKSTDPRGLTSIDEE